MPLACVYGHAVCSCIVDVGHAQAVVVVHGMFVTGARISAPSPMGGSAACSWFSDGAWSAVTGGGWAWVASTVGG